MLHRRSLPARPAPPLTIEGSGLRVFVGTMTDNDLESNACFAMVATINLPTAIRKIQATTRHKARGHWRETDDQTLIELALTRPSSVFMVESGYTPDPEVFTPNGYAAKPRFKLR